MTGNMNPARIKTAVDAIAFDLDKESDMDPEAGAKTVTVRGAKSVQPEVVGQLTRLAVRHGVPIFMIVLGSKGEVQFTVLSTMEKMCQICTKGATKLHNDGVCYDCRDPNVNPEAWVSFPEHYLKLSPVKEEEESELTRALYYDIKDGANVAHLASSLQLPASREALAKALRRLAADLDA